MKDWSVTLAQTVIGQCHLTLKSTTKASGQKPLFPSTVHPSEDPQVKLMSSVQELFLIHTERKVRVLLANETLPQTHFKHKS